METLLIIPKKEYLLVKIDHGKVNAINSTLVRELIGIFEKAEMDPGIKGIVLAGKPKYFSAGLDLPELYSYDDATIRGFFTSFSKMHILMSRFSKPFVCAVTGYSPAGGTVIALTADYRVMADNPVYSIGLNEMQVNVQISTDLIESYCYWLGSSIANRFILDGKLLNPKEALSYNLVDEICSENEVIDRAERKMKQYLFADLDIFRNTKIKLRAKWWRGQSSEANNELEEAVKMWWKPENRAKIKFLIESFSSKKS